MPIDKKDIPVTDRAVTMEKIIALCKNRGYIFPGSEIYGGLANTWDFGPLGVEFKNNIKDAWRQKFVRESGLNVGLDAAILMNPQTWVASGHVGGFSDPLSYALNMPVTYDGSPAAGIHFTLTSDEGGTIEAVTDEEGMLRANLLEDMDYTIHVDDENVGVSVFALAVKDKSEHKGATLRLLAPASPRPGRDWLPATFTHHSEESCSNNILHSIGLGYSFVGLI